VKVGDLVRHKRTGYIAFILRLSHAVNGIGRKRNPMMVDVMTISGRESGVIQTVRLLSNES